MTRVEPLATDILPASVQSFLESNPPRLVGRDFDVRPKLKPPSLFYQRHLDSRLVLRRVHAVPLETLLSRVVDLTLESLAGRGISLPGLGPHAAFDRYSCSNHKVSNDAQSISRAYRNTTSWCSSTLACTLLLHPRAQAWSDSSMMFGEFPQSGKSGTASLQCWALTIGPSQIHSEGLKKYIDTETCEIMDALHERYRPLAYWQTFFVDEEAKELLKDLDRTALDHAIEGSCRTLGFIEPSIATFPIPLDAPETPWGSPISSLIPELAPSKKLPKINTKNGCNTRSRAIKNTHTTRHRGNLNIHPASKSVERPGHDNIIWPDVQLGVQKLELRDSFLLQVCPFQRFSHLIEIQSHHTQAWAQSVEADTTFIIFHCGNFERIGFRHRETQTLLITDLIDIPDCSNPPYGRLQGGLYLAILQDAISRLKQQQAIDKEKPKSRRRRREPEDVPTTTRYNTRSAVSKELNEARNLDVLKQHASKCPLALVTLRYGNYNSVSPSAFLRSGATEKTTYGPNEYFSLVLTSEIGSGGVGTVYRAKLEAVIDGSLCETLVAVKLGFTKYHTERLLLENSAYERLSKGGVTEGIPFVFGLFRDTESDVAALVMSYHGQCLRSIRPPGHRIVFPAEIQDAYVQTLRSIHRAGVCHGDIREENLMLMNYEKPAIVDFDHSRMSPSAIEAEQEMEILLAVLTEVPSDVENQSSTSYEEDESSDDDSAIDNSETQEEVPDKLRMKAGESEIT
ncbi:hypothetical protein H0H93_005667 [Arthromyces matolae]|nr:hypothetical protein H0H93_005667 [Arthromyces matolae]